MKIFRFGTELETSFDKYDFEITMDSGNANMESIFLDVPLAKKLRNELDKYIKKQAQPK